jgi:hypothetical protein
LTGRHDTERLLVAVLASAGFAAGVVALTTAASAASRPSVRVSHACYQLAQKGTVHGSGFDPSAHWTAKLDGKAFGNGTTSSAGTITANFGVPSHLRKGSTGEDSYKLVVREGKHSASATFLVTHLSASFSPAGGNLSTLKVSFSLLGWGRGGTLYLHYVNPNGTVRLTRALGSAGGACGHLVTSLEKLFPFTPTVGKWTLQFDKNPSYRAITVPRVGIRYKIS